ncbi:MAG: hypothetical protein LBD73_03750, partial [Deferribacteraceae bacterium]|nr:hypothetical protein [Deferribacteraceae bacterium]
MGLKFFRRGAAFFIFLFFIHSIVFSQDNAAEVSGGSISSVAVLADGSVAAAVNTESAGRIIILSPKDCVSSRRFAFDKPVAKILTDTGDIGAVWGITQGSLKKWSILDGKELAAIEAAPGEILRGFLKSEDRFLVW